MYSLSSFGKRLTSSARLVKLRAIGVLAFGGFGLVTLSSLGLASSGCGPVGYTEISSSPYYDYPYTYYDGRVVYLVDNRWMYRDAGGAWFYYRQEPPYLYQQRSYVGPGYYGYGGYGGGGYPGAYAPGGGGYGPGSSRSVPYVQQAPAAPRSAPPMTAPPAAAPHMAPPPAMAPPAGRIQGPVAPMSQPRTAPPAVRR